MSSARDQMFRKRLNLKNESTKQSDEKDAGVLILLRDEVDDVKVLLCVRSQNLRTHPGEVCFPGGMIDAADDGNVQKTAIREAYEEVGVTEDDYSILGNFPPIRSRLGILIHPTIAMIKRSLKIVMNESEVESVFWISLSCFLEDQYHSVLTLDSIYFVHIFQFHDAPTTFGITALMCILVAIGVMNEKPEFDLLANLTTGDMASMSCSGILKKTFDLTDNFQIKSIRKSKI